MSLIRAAGLGKYYGALDVFKNASFSIEHQDRIGLVGPNGEGKTTLLRLLAGIEEATSGKLETKPLKGWGFTYYEVAKFGPAASTLIGVPAGTPKVEKFVAGPSQLIRYNSRIPIVVYVPQGAEVRYRIWSAKPGITIAPEK